MSYSTCRSLLLFMVGGLWFVGASHGYADERATPPGEAPQFLRVPKDERQRPTSLETAIARYVPAGASKDSARYIDLIGAVHIGERSYYEELNRAFRDYDAVLYELVAPADNNVPQPGHRSGHPVGFMQVAMKNLLELEFQLDRVDYRQPNLVHADLTPDEFHKSMEERSESFSKMFFRLMGQGLAQQSKDPGRTSDLAVFSALLSRDRALEFKRTLAIQFEEMETATLAFDGPQGSTIITERNKRALSVLEGQMRNGKGRLAIFYGAAHLPDFHRNLREKLNYVPATTRWVVAWNLSPPQNRARADKSAR